MLNAFRTTQTSLSPEEQFGLAAAGLLRFLGMAVDVPAVTGLGVPPDRRLDFLHQMADWAAQVKFLSQQAVPGSLACASSGVAPARHGSILSCVCGYTVCNFQD